MKAPASPPGPSFISCASAGTESGGKCCVGQLVTTRFAEVARFAQSRLVASHRRVGVSGQTAGEAAPIYGIKIPAGYRDWRLISVAHEEGNFNDLRAQLGNDVAIKAYREGKLPFPDGTIIVALHWHYVSSEENNKAFGRTQSFIAGSPTNIQFMVKDSKKYAGTGGWGFADFTDGKPANEAVHRTCFPCHEPVKARDFVFTRYAP